MDLLNALVEHNKFNKNNYLNLGCGYLEYAVEYFKEKTFRHKF